MENEAINVVLLKKVSDRLESNLKVISEALDFVQELTEEDIACCPQGYEPYSSYSALIVYFLADKDISKFRAFIRGYHKERGSNFDGWLFLERDHPLVFNAEADRIEKEVEAQLSVICSALGLGRPSFVLLPPKRALAEAMNIINAARSIAGD